MLRNGSPEPPRPPTQNKTPEEMDGENKGFGSVRALAGYLMHTEDGKIYKENMRTKM